MWRKRALDDIPSQFSHHGEKRMFCGIECLQPLWTAGRRAALSILRCFARAHGNDAEFCVTARWTAMVLPRPSWKKRPATNSADYATRRSAAVRSKGRRFCATIAA